MYRGELYKPVQSTFDLCPIRLLFSCLHPCFDLLNGTAKGPQRQRSAPLAAHLPLSHSLLPLDVLNRGDRRLRVPPYHTGIQHILLPVC